MRPDVARMQLILRKKNWIAGPPTNQGAVGLQILPGAPYK
jgi:hypothetical protein